MEGKSIRAFGGTGTVLRTSKLRRDSGAPAKCTNPIPETPLWFFERARPSRKNRKSVCNFGVVLCALLVVIHLAAICAPAAAQTYFYKYGNFATGNNPSGFITADFNRDRKTDLAVINYTDNTVSILLGKPDGTFAPQTVY